MAEDRLQLTADGRVLLELKSEWADGTSHLLFEPLELVGGLMLALVLVAPIPVRAACAWVLWVESKRVGEGAPPTGATSWSIDPDTIDPRGPKGEAR